MRTFTRDIEFYFQRENITRENLNEITRAHSRGIVRYLLPRNTFCFSPAFSLTRVCALVGTLIYAFPFARECQSSFSQYCTWCFTRNCFYFFVVNRALYRAQGFFFTFQAELCGITLDFSCVIARCSIPRVKKRAFFRAE